MINFLKLVLLISFSLTLSSCDFAQNTLKTDRSGDMEFQDYRDAMAPRTPEPTVGKGLSASGTIPKLQPYVAGSSSSLSSMPLVSISLNQTIPLRDALYELAQQADFDITLDPRISGAIIFSARNKPLDEVVEDISQIAGLRYKFEGSSLRVELDTPVNRSYKIDYLSLVRSNSSSISTDVSVVSGDGADTGSSFESSFENEIDFWGELETSLNQILSSASTDILKTSNDPEITVTALNPDVETVGGRSGVAAPDVNLNIGSLPLGNGEGYTQPELSYSINKQAGIVQVFAPERIHKKIDQYFKLLRKSVTSQVLIEAKILEVTLSDQYQAGIQWGAVNGIFGDFDFGFNPAGIVPTNTAATPVFFLNAGAEDFSTLVNAASQFGTVKALASPRLTVLNNQSAVLNVATNRVFFEIDVDIQNATADTPRSVNVTSDIRNVPVGVLVNVQPAIDVDRGTISMALRPTITSVDSEVADPGVAFAAAGDPLLAGVQSLIPQLNVQELDTLINMRSGQAVIMGGLLQDRVQTEEIGIPGLSEIPIAGHLFKNKDDTITKTELVIFLKATILDDPQDSVHNTDRDLYRRFSDDRRPLSL